MIPDGGDSWNFDVVVVGAGPAGIAAACICAEAGKRVLLVDQGFRAGGQIWRNRSAGDLPVAARKWVARLEASRVVCSFQSTVVSVQSQVQLTVVRGSEVLDVATSHIVLATGARELFLSFPGWTLPWVVGAGGAQALLKQGTSFAGKRVVVAGSGPLLLPVAAALASSGARVTHVLEQARAAALARYTAKLLSNPSLLLQAARYTAGFGVHRYFTSAWVKAAHGEEKVEGVSIVVRGRREEVPCDVLCTGYGLVPSAELASAAGCEVEGGAVRVDENQRSSVPNIFCVGESAGVAGVENATAQGANAAYAILGATPPSFVRREVQRGRRTGEDLAATFRLRAELLARPPADTVACRCEDVRDGGLGGGWAWREMKLRTRTGMGPCQGRICGESVRARMGIGPTDSRSPIFPSPVRALMARDETEV